MLSVSAGRCLAFSKTAREERSGSGEMEQTRGIDTATNVNVSNYKPLVLFMEVRKREAGIHLESK